MRITLFKMLSPKGFNYRPRYYDAQKEQREERLKRIRQEIKSENAVDFDPEAMRQKLKSTWDAGDNRRTEGRASNFRVFIIALILAVGGYLLFFTDLFA